jgi:hypothetical protein
MTLLKGMRAVAFGQMSERPLADYLRARGVEVTGEPSDLDGADFLIDDVGLTGMASLGFDRVRLEREHPSLIHGSVTTFGSTGPKADWRGGELIASAMGGTLLLTGEPGSTPVKEALDACTFHADMIAAAGAMAALYSRLRAIYVKAKKDPKKLEYMDLAMTPVTDDETDTLEMFHTPSAPAFVAQEQRRAHAHEHAAVA